ncbi:MAG: enoyl-CoA hydratase/isomerase family protein [Gammaproteobacteria bacterium]
MNYQYLTLSHDGPIATVTFNRPEKANATNFGLLAEIEQVSLSFRDDLKTRVVIFTGAGNNFCSGMDLSDDNKDYGESLLQRRRTTRIGGRAIRAMCDIDQITIAAWSGAAVGGGAVITTATDFRVGTATAKICYPEVILGMNLMWFGLPLIVHLVGPARAKRLVAGAEWLNASQLLEWGLLDELTDDESPLPLANRWAQNYAEKPPIAVQMIKQSVNKLSSALDYSIMHMDVDQNVFTQSSKDNSEAVRAYLAKEKPTFIGD